MSAKRKTLLDCASGSDWRAGVRTYMWLWFCVSRASQNARLYKIVRLGDEIPAILWLIQNSDDLLGGYRSTSSQMNRASGLEAAECRAN